MIDIYLLNLIGRKEVNYIFNFYFLITNLELKYMIINRQHFDPD